MGRAGRDLDDALQARNFFRRGSSRSVAETKLPAAVVPESGDASVFF